MIVRRPKRRGVRAAAVLAALLLAATAVGACSDDEGGDDEATGTTETSAAVGDTEGTDEVDPATTATTASTASTATEPTFLFVSADGPTTITVLAYCPDGAAPTAVAFSYAYLEGTATSLDGNQFQLDLPAFPSDLTDEATLDDFLAEVSLSQDEPEVAAVFTAEGC